MEARSPGSIPRGCPDTGDFHLVCPLAWAAVTNTADRGEGEGLKQQRFTSHSSGGRKSNIKAPRDSVLVEGLVSGPTHCRELTKQPEVF